MTIVITPRDVHVYRTLAGSWRAYLKNYREHFSNEMLYNLNVWSINHDRALDLFRERLIKYDIPFDWTDNK